MMETRLIMLPNPIVVSDEEIKEGDILPYVMKWENGYEVFNLNNGIRESKLSRAYKIIAGIEGLPKLDLSLIAERIGWVDVRLAAQKYRDEKYEQIAIGKNKPQAITASLHAEQGWFDGFNTSQSLNEKKYSEEDMIEFAKFYKGWDAMVSQENWDILKDTPDNLFKFWLSKRKPKEYQVEVEMEVNQCDGCISGHHIIDGIHKTPYPSGSMVCKKHLYDRPKIINNTITVIRVL